MLFIQELLLYQWRIIKGKQFITIWLTAERGHHNHGGYYTWTGLIKLMSMTTHLQSFLDWWTPSFFFLFLRTCNSMRSRFTILILMETTWKMSISMIICLGQWFVFKWLPANESVQLSKAVLKKYYIPLQTGLSKNSVSTYENYLQRLGLFRG